MSESPLGEPGLLLARVRSSSRPPTDPRRLLLLPQHEHRGQARKGRAVRQRQGLAVLPPGCRAVPQGDGQLATRGLPSKEASQRTPWQQWGEGRQAGRLGSSPVHVGTAAPASGDQRRVRGVVGQGGVGGLAGHAVGGQRARHAAPNLVIQ